MSATFGQSVSAITQKSDTITLKLQQVAGFGPTGTTWITMHGYTNYKDEKELSAFPKLQNIPVTLSNVSKHVYIIGNFQYYFQSYVAGVISRSFFEDKASVNNWTLTDTIKLSRKPLKCFFTAITGLDIDKNAVYMVDANNNNDYSDELIRPLRNNLRLEEEILKNAVTVKTSYVDNGDLKFTDILVSIQPGRDPQAAELWASFPQFSYTKFVYKGRPFLVCTANDFGRKAVCVLADRPYFTPVDRGATVGIDHFVNILGENFKVADIDVNKQTVTLTGNVDGFSGLSTTEPGVGPGVAMPQNNNIVSDQLGYIAPEIKGIDFNPLSTKGTQISLNKLRGKYVFIDFWSTYCGPCIMELPNLKAAYKKYPRNKFEIIGVFDERDKAATMKLLTDNGVTWPNILMNNKSTDLSGYGHVSSFPTTFLIDPSGKIIGVDLRDQDLMNRIKGALGY